MVGRFVDSQFGSIWFEGTNQDGSKRRHRDICLRLYTSISSNKVLNEIKTKRIKNAAVYGSNKSIHLQLTQPNVLMIFLVPKLPGSKDTVTTNGLRMNLQYLVAVHST